MIRRGGGRGMERGVKMTMVESGLWTETWYNLVVGMPGGCSDD